MRLSELGLRRDPHKQIHHEELQAAFVRLMTACACNLTPEERAEARAEEVEQ